MQRGVIIAGGLAALILCAMAIVYENDIARWAALRQREFQNALAGGVRAIMAGERLAWAGFLGMCLAYGFVHAVGPGHGKFIVGAYGFARQISAARLAGISAAASLGQAVTAVLLTLGGITLFGLSRDRLTAMADRELAMASLAAIGLIGLWLVWRGLRRLWRMARPSAPAHDHHDTACADCGHRHAPGLHDIAAASGPREIAALILSVAIRPCSGAILLLVLCWQLGIIGAGIAGAFAMGAGTAAFTVMVALAATSVRAGAVAGISASPLLRSLAGAMELAAGVLIISLTVTGWRMV
ncbi:MAG: hypothetical protein Q4G36_04065 [Paracoccus sp. (in: a-proteobacteria)]|nr:hypothetical protein [Paracoccus sp. (in: a-proteobacteria)]